jgi:inhibitor of KinA
VMSEFPWAISWASDASLRIALDVPASPAAGRLVRAAQRRLRSAAIPALLDISPAFTTLLLTFDPRRLDPAAAEAAIRSALARPDPTPELPPRTIEVPVCYEGDLAPDLPELASMHGLSPAEVISIHSGASYTVEFLGFSPGFGYLSGLPERLATPRLGRPRPRVPAGSVGIAGGQTGIYPQATPGGWRLIGRTSLKLFDPAADPPPLLSPGDHVRFIPIPRARYDELAPGRPAPGGRP